MSTPHSIVVAEIFQYVVSLCLRKLTSEKFY
jgi:hypothetical protein